MNQMEKAKRLLGVLTVIHRDRESRLETHLGVDTNACGQCHYHKIKGSWYVDFCDEALRLAKRIRRVRSLARVISLLILEAVEAYR
jgi:hypothetical protein